MTFPPGLGQDETIRSLRLAGSQGPVVLVVDDEPEVVEELAGLLGRRGLRVLSAGSAEAAQTLLQDWPEISVLVSDIHLPGLDGLALAAATLRDRAEADAVEVVLITGHASEAQARTASRLGAFGLLQKPMRGAELARMVQDALSRAALRRGGATGFGWVARPTAALPPIPEPPPRQGRPRPPAPHPGTDAAAVALLERLALRVDLAGEDMSGIARDLDGPLGDLLRAAAPVPAGQTGLISVLDDLLDLVALEHGRARLAMTLTPATALADAAAAGLAQRGLRCTRRITLRPDAEPGVRMDVRRLARAIALIAPQCSGSAELGIEVEAGQARVDLVIRPDVPAAAASGLARAIATRMAMLAGGRLDCWPLPGGEVRARLQVRAR